MKNELISLLEKHQKMSDYTKSVLDTIDFTPWLDTYDYSDISDMMDAMDEKYSRYTESDDILNGMLFRWMDENELVKYLKERYADKFDVEEQVMYIIKNKKS